jgi:protein-S-isoprenylcysteine O-methyltransferase Ste14
MQINDWRMVRNLLLIFGLIFIGGGIYVATTAGMLGSSFGWTTVRGLALAAAGWDLGLLIIGSCSISTAAILHFRIKEEEPFS